MTNYSYLFQCLSSTESDKTDRKETSYRKKVSSFI